MENQDYKFIPVGDQPTKENLKKNLFKAIILVAVVCAVASNFGKADQQIFYLAAFILISVIVYGIMVTTRYIRFIEIDPIHGFFYSEYITVNGKEGRDEINLFSAKYSYRFSASMGYQGYIMELKYGQSKLEIRETKSRKKKDQKNRFLRDQLDKMNQIILQIKQLESLN